MCESLMLDRRRCFIYVREREVEDARDKHDARLPTAIINCGTAWRPGDPELHPLTVFEILLKCCIYRGLVPTNAPLYA
jgi:hypothetical protein